MSTTDFTHTLQLLTEMMAVQQRSLMDAQLATYKHLTQLYTPQAPSESQRANLSSHVDDSLSASQSLMLAHVQAGIDVMALSEKLVSELNRQLVHSLHQSPAHPAREALESAASVGKCAFESLSKATRQINQFACTNLSTASLQATKQARAHLSKRHQ